jgi:hypothetical protein
MAAVGRRRLISHGSLQLLLLGLAHKWRLPSKGLLELAEEVGYVHSIPNVAPVS